LTDWPRIEIPVGEAFKRVYLLAYPSISFKPGQGNPADPCKGGRFDPIQASAGHYISTLYMADHTNGAFAEVLLRQGSPTTVPFADVYTRGLVSLSVNRPLSVIDLADRSINEIVQCLLSQSQKSYPALRRLAADLHAQYPDIAGLSWNGRQLNRAGMRCYLLFGDRVDELDLTEISSSLLLEGAGLQAFWQAMRDLGFNPPSQLL